MANKVDRSEVYASIDRERDYQDRVWPNEFTSVGDVILALEEYVTRARSVWAGEPAPETGALGMIRKVAAIAVRGMEQHGVIER